MEKLIFDKPGKYEVTLQLNEEGQTVEWLGLMNARNAGDYELSVKVIHHCPNTTGKIIIKGVAENGAKLRILGRVVIEKQAEESESSLVMKALIVDRQSMAEVSPEMEILTNKVKASHSASAGKIDEEQLFYLESRGLDKQEAKKMIIKGFIQ